MTHPELAEEQGRLVTTVEAMTRTMERPLKEKTGTADFAALMAIEEHRAWRRIQLREALPSPYFARIDFLPADSRTGRVERYYVGKTYFFGDEEDRGTDCGVTGWQAPVAALFYRAAAADAENAAYEAPQGIIRGALSLKRRLVIDHGTLALIADDLDTRPTRPAGGVAAPGIGDELLRRTLSEAASPWLRDIIATIQARQYELIAAPADQVLVVQGVAGSGKTSIALHRLSYHVYPALVGGKVPPRCIVFGPNRLFLKYVAAVLPKLGLHRVTQTTIADWALERMGLEHLRLTDATFDALLDPALPAAQKDRRYRASRLKTSRRMASLLERYVAWRRAQLHVPEDGWPVQLTVQRTVGILRLERRVPAAALRERHARFAERPFAVHRAMCTESVLTLVHGLFETNAQGEQAEAEAQLALGKRRLQQAAELRAEVVLMRSSNGGSSTAGRSGGSGGNGGSGTAGRPASRPVFGAPPAFGTAPLPRPGTASWGQAGARGSANAPGVAAGASGALLQQTLRTMELAAERRQQEGKELVRAAQAALAAVLTPEVQEQVRRAARAQVEKLMDDHWPAIEPLRDYYALLADAPLLASLAGGLFTPEEVALLCATPGGRKAGTVDLSDLPAIHYLFVISQGPEAVGRIGHEYLVVDEAQDVSELDLYCLRTLERRHRFTLLGDLSQSIYGHRGLTSWAQAAAIFQGLPYVHEDCPVSYRTTAEITELANLVLRSLGSLPAGDDSVPTGGEGDAPAAVPTPAAAQAFDRHGPPPVLGPAADEDALLDAIGRAIGAAGAAGGSVAVIAKTLSRARQLAARLQEAGHAGVALIDRSDVDYRGGTVVLPVHLAKGLEFDAAVVVDADARTYTASAFDARLLYVALTRALHRLHVLWCGELSPHLQQ